MELMIRLSYYFLIEFFEIRPPSFEIFALDALFESIFSELPLEGREEDILLIRTVRFVVREKFFQCLMYRCSIACRFALRLREAEDIIRDEVCRSSRGHIEKVLKSSGR